MAWGGMGWVGIGGGSGVWLWLVAVLGRWGVWRGPAAMLLVGEKADLVPVVSSTSSPAVSSSSSKSRDLRSLRRDLMPGADFPANDFPLVPASCRFGIAGTFYQAGPLVKEPLLGYWGKLIRRTQKGTFIKRTPS